MGWRETEHERGVEERRKPAASVFVLRLGRVRLQ
jgi:hypothetical protein